MVADSWEAWDQEDFTEEERKFLGRHQELYRLARERISDVTRSSDFDNRLMETIRHEPVPSLETAMEDYFSLDSSSEDLEDDQWTPLLALFNNQTQIDYHICRRPECAYQVTPVDEYCPNCGIFSPYSTPNNVSKIHQYINILLDNRIFSIFLFILFSILIIYLIYLSSIGNTSQVTKAARIFVLVSLIPSAFYLSNYIKDNLLKLLEKCDYRRRIKFYEKYSKENDYCLVKDEESIENRLRQINDQELKMKQELEDTPHERSKKMFERRLEILPSRRQQNQESLCEIALIRWHNKLRPIYSNALNLTQEEYENRIERWIHFIHEGEMLQNEWSQKYSPNLEALERLQNGLAICRHLQGELEMLRDEVIAGIPHMEQSIESQGRYRDYMEFILQLGDIERYSARRDELRSEEILMQQEINKDTFPQ